MFRKALVFNTLLAALAPLAHTQALTSPCVYVPATYVNAVDITTSPNVDVGGQITNAIAQALAQGGNTVVVNSGGSPAPMTTPVVLSNLSNFNLIMRPGTNIYGYDLNHPMFSVIGGYNVKILGGTLYGLSPDTAPPVCVSILGTDGDATNTVEVNSLACSGTTGHGIEVVGYGKTFTNVQNISIHSTFVHDTGSVNIYGSGVNNLCVNSNVLVNPSTGGVAGSGDPSNVAVSYSENVYFGQNYVAGTPTWFRQPNPINTPPAGFYAFSSQNVNTDSNVFVSSQCTVATCSGTSDLPSSSLRGSRRYDPQRH